MTAENDVQLKTFEAMVRVFGAEAARRNFAQLMGEAAALNVRKAYEIKVGLIKQLPSSPTLQGKPVDDWYSGPSDDDQFWPPLKKFLLEGKKWPASTVDSVDRESTNVMRRLPPVFGLVDVKGLVVGYVQSGKTANYSALIAKAADVGYRLIIVLSGIHNSLRRQTQIRLQAELINSNEHVKKMWHTLTLPRGDVRARGLNADAFLSDDSHQRILLVVRKSPLAFRRLINWLSTAQPRLLNACPALLIDAAAEHAGLNTGKIGEDAHTVFNRLILKLRKTLPKSAYVGYASTPCTNMLIEPLGEDLSFKRS